MKSKYASINEPLVQLSGSSLEAEQMDYMIKKKDQQKNISIICENKNISDSSKNSSLYQNNLKSQDQRSDYVIERRLSSKKMSWRKRLVRFFTQSQEKNINYENPSNFFNQVIQDLSNDNIGFEQKGMKRYISGEKTQDIQNPSPYPMFNCESPYLIFWEILVYSQCVIYFFLIPLEIFFPDQVRNHQITQIFQLILISLLTINFFQVLNTSMYIHGELIKNRAVIFKKRIRNWQFFIDVICLTIIILDMLIQETRFPSFAIVFYLKITTIFRFDKKFLNLIQLMRRMKAGYLLIRLTCGIMFLCHIAACIYLKVGQYQLNGYSQDQIDDDKPQSWLAPYLKYPFFIQFLWALYWAVTTILTVGYGDITPKEPNEVVVTIICMLISCVIFAYCINSIWEILQDLKKKEVKYMEIMNAINRYMRDKSVNTQLKLKIRAYIQYYYKKQKSRDEGMEQVIISKLPPNLREELIYQSHIEIFEKVNWMKYFSEEFIKNLAFQIEEYHYPEREPIYCMGEDLDNEFNTQGLYFVKEGTVECYIPYSEGKTENAVFERQLVQENGYGIDTLKQQRKKNLGIPIKSLKKDIYLKNLVKNQHFGETSIFLNEQIPFSVKSVDFSTVYKISRKNFIETIKKFPDDYEIFCEIKDELEFRQYRKRFPKFNCEYCNKNTKIDNYQHQIIECPNIIPHICQRQQNIDFVKNQNEIQVRNKSFKRLKKRELHSIRNIYLIQSFAKRAAQNFGDYLLFDEISFSRSSFISQTSQQAILEKDDESENEDSQPIKPKKVRRNNHKFRTLTEDVSSPKVQSLQDQGDPFFSITNQDNLDIDQQHYYSEQEEYQDDIPISNKRYSQDFVAIISDEDTYGFSKNKTISSQQFKGHKQKDGKLINQYNKDQKQKQEDINIARNQSSQHNQNDQNKYSNIQGINVRKQKYSKQYFGSQVRLESSQQKLQQNAQTKSINVVSSEKQTQLVQETTTSNNVINQQQSIQNTIESYLAEIKQMIKNEIQKNKQQSQVLKQPQNYNSIKENQDTFGNHLIQTQQLNNLPNDAENYINQNRNQLNLNDNQQSIIDDQDLFIQEFDKMFKFKTYKTDYNYDIVIDKFKRQRKRVLKQTQRQNNGRRATQSKANLKSRKSSINTDLGFSKAKKNNKKDRTKNSQLNDL
ncbi:cation channel family protein (macronuclear) [Tetrahymena thermophila SB210]|uniref:Cation channel family protein n=1 Tax=Tetrahymena thermophila (strain SB210) TaxID=312017 RepID=I7LVV8_TETTS|nr:cation channel family protein [Tetrahymena thermophila SB210]EAR99913.2 cation channel family protein [Tetrahymena thermophila SB210]|eukprot:XP_001020158.2 cation channel family protein [Tetrahymena thermophila SB210]